MEMVGMGEREALGAPVFVIEPLGLGEPLRLSTPDPVASTGVPLGLPPEEALKDSEEPAEAEAMDPLAAPLVDTSGLSVPLEDRDCVEEGRGDRDTEGEGLSEGLTIEVREREGVADTLGVPGEEGEIDGDTPPLPLPRGLLDTEKEALPELDREALGDKERVALAEALGLGDWDAGAEGGGDLLLLRVVFPEGEGRGLLDRVGLEVGVRGALGDLPPLPVPTPTPCLLGVTVDTTL